MGLDQVSDQIQSAVISAVMVRFLSTEILRSSTERAREPFPWLRIIAWL